MFKSELSFRVSLSYTKAVNGCVKNTIALRKEFCMSTNLIFVTEVLVPTMLLCVNPGILRSMNSF